MFLKKINPDLSQALEDAGLTQPTALQKATFGIIKSGADCVISAPKEEGKTNTIVINVIQRLEKEFEESPRALIIVQTKEKVQEVQDLFKKYGRFTDLRVYGVHEKGDLDYDKNQISLGIDVLVGTPNRLSDMFSSAGFDVNQLKMFIIDDAYEILKLRHDTRIARMSEGVLKMQRLFFTTQISDRVEALADRMMIEPNFFEFEEEEDEDDEEEEDADAETETENTNETE